MSIGMPLWARRRARLIASAAGAVTDTVRNPELGWFRWKARGLDPGMVANVRGYRVRINDAPNLLILYKDLFLKRIYHFDSEKKDPVVLDLGSNIGMSILYFKHVYPMSRVIGYEPDPAVFLLLEENVERNGLQGVQVVQAAVAGREGVLPLQSDAKYGSFLGDAPPPEGAGWRTFEVPCIPLSHCLSEPVDFMKMNIEGAEFEALHEAGNRLRAVREMVIEYHHLPGLPRTLHRILSLLDDQGFEYLINDFDSATNSGVDPPFHLGPDARYFLLVYARRID